MANPYVNNGNPNAPTTVPFKFWGKPVNQASDGTYWCPGFDGATYATNEWDYVIIGGQKTPGVAEVSVTAGRNVDKKQALGRDGANLTAYGVRPADVEITITIWTPEQFRQLLNLWPTWFPSANKLVTTANMLSVLPFGNILAAGIVSTPMTFDAQHPALQYNQVKSLMFLGAKGPHGSAADRTRTVVLSASEYLPPTKKNATQTVTGSVGNSKTDVQPLPSAYGLPGSNPNDTGPR